MLVTPLGVGDAFDADQTNSACLIEERGFSLLVDCGHSVPTALWRARPDPHSIDAVFLTHLHSDHVVGLPSVIERWSWGGRRKPLEVITTADGRRLVDQFCALLGIEPRFELRYADSATAKCVGPFGLRTALTEHVLPNRALRLEASGRRLAYSGDGRPTDASRALFADAHLLLHECWEPEAAPHISFHADLPTVRGIVGPDRIGLYHIRAGLREAMQAQVAGDPRLFVLQAGVPIEV